MLIQTRGGGEEIQRQSSASCQYPPCLNSRGFRRRAVRDAAVDEITGRRRDAGDEDPAALSGRAAAQAGGGDGHLGAGVDQAALRRALDGAARDAGPGDSCSPSHRMEFDSKSEGLKRGGCGGEHFK